jgi:DUF971 family protein
VTEKNAESITYWPLKIHYHKSNKNLTIDYDNGITFTYPAELLRVESPSAEVKGHGMEEKKIISGRSHVGIIKLEPVGNYAIQIYFDDLHNTGIFSWSYLYDLGKRKDKIWQTYIKKLAEQNLSRHPQ